MILTMFSNGFLISKEDNHILEFQCFCVFFSFWCDQEGEKNTIFKNLIKKHNLKKKKLKKNSIQLL